MNTTSIIDTNPQVSKTQAKQLSWRVKLLLTIGIVLMLSIILIVVNTSLVIGATTGLDLTLRVIWSALIDVFVFATVFLGILLFILTRVLCRMSVKLVGTAYYQNELKPLLIATGRGLIAFIAWKFWEWAKLSQSQTHWQPGPGWTTAAGN